jgi:uncharacterized protein (TIGR02453 family)
MNKIDKSTLSFLSDLKKHNDREWFAANRKRYEDAKNNFEILVQSVINEIIVFDPILKGLEVKSCVFRINRDIRFSNDKTIYKTHLGAYIGRGGRKNFEGFAGYYVHVETGGNSMIAGGAYVPAMPRLTAIREKISEEGESLVKIITNKEFVKFFGQIDGEKLKSAPKGFSRDHKYIEYLKLKSFSAARLISDKEIVSDDCLDLIIRGAKIVKPLNDFLNEL